MYRLLVLWKVISYLFRLQGFSQVFAYIAIIKQFYNADDIVVLCEYLYPNIVDVSKSEGVFGKWL